jgi:hypothetical protein
MPPLCDRAAAHLDFLCGCRQVSGTTKRRHARLPPGCRAGCGLVPRAKSRGEKLVLDVILIAAAVAFFALSIAYAFGCEHL